MAAARKSGEAVPVAALTDENTDVSAQPDGTLVATIHAQPVRTRKGGKWTAIDTALQTAPDGSISPKAVLPGLEFSGGGSEPLVWMSSAGRQLSLSWPDPLPAPVIDGDTAEYRNILPDIDLRMTATADGFSQLVVVKTAEAAQNPALDQLKFGMSSNNLTMHQDFDGSLSAVDAGGGGAVFVAQQPMMFDSSSAAKDGPGTASQAADSTMSRADGSAEATDAPADGEEHAAPVGVQIADDQTSMTLTPDQDLLASPSTVYPVMIDPGITTPHAGGWAGISRTNPSQAYWKFSYNSTYVADFGTGYCVAPTCSTNDVKRVLYSLPVHGQAFNGKHILAAEFDVEESHSYSCTKENVQLYATSRISSGTTWNNSSSTSGTSPFWAQRLQTVSAAKGWSSSCPAGTLEFGTDDTQSTPLRTKVQQAADGNWTDLTLGLKAESETDPDAWKRFTDDASLRVHYNLPPRQAAMKDMTMSPGSVCQLSTVLVNKWPQLTARVFDPDGDRVGVQFSVSWKTGETVKRQWWSTGSADAVPASNTFKASGSLFNWSLPALSAPVGAALDWEVRAWDGAEWGPWSSAGANTGCYFVVDTSAPDGPAVTSSSFPGSATSTAELQWTDGVGQYGTFSFLSAPKEPSDKPDSLTYQYSEDSAPSALHAVTPPAGSPGVVRLLQQTEGLHTLSVRAVDSAGNSSSVSSYQFLVKAGQLQHEGWAMDDASGAGSLAGSGGAFQATLSGSAAGGAPGHTGTALSLPGGLASDGTPADFASTSGAVLNTSGSFTVSAWVNLADTSIGRAAVSQDGSYVGGFSLGLYGGQWTFKTASKDAPGYTWQSAASAQAVTTGTWTHLTGVYDQAAHTQTIYVNGVPSAAVAAPATPTATGALQFGRILWQGAYTDAWKGSVDDVHLWNRVLTPAEAANLAAGTQVTTGLPAKAVWTLDEPGSTMTGTGEASDAMVSGSVTTGVDGVADKAARFGSNGSASTGRPQVDGSRTFSVSAWVRLPAPAAGDTSSKVALTQNGVHNSEFSLYYSAYYKEWIFGRNQEDSATATLVRTMQPACTVGQGTVFHVPCIGPTTGEWTHLVGVSDAVAHQNQLYVNGYLVSTTAYTQTSPWPTPKGLEMGADNRDGVDSEFFGGDIDDVRVFDRVVTAAEVQTMIQQRPQLTGRWKFNDATTTTPPTSPDDVKFNAATLYNGAGISTNANLGAGALNLDGQSSYAATSNAAPLRTGESFTVAGWVQLAKTTQDGAVLSIGDGTDNAVSLRWHYLRTDQVDPDYPELDTVVGQWQAETVSGGTSRAHTVVVQSAVGVTGVWTHLAVTYDAFSNQVALYVNGQLEDKPCDHEDTSGTCTEEVSYTGADQPFEATSGLQFGRMLTKGSWDQFLDGQIDDVWAYRGVLTSAQVISLAYAGELDSTSGT